LTEFSCNDVVIIVHKMWLQETMPVSSPYKHFMLAPPNYILAATGGQASQSGN